MCSRRKCRGTSPHPNGKGRLQEAVTCRCKEEADKGWEGFPAEGKP